MKLACCELNGLTGHEAGRMLLKALYRDATGEDLPQIETTTRGKPYFPDSPWHFSISHTKRHAFCVLAKENIAIDAEEEDREIHLKLAEKILSPGEREQFDAAQNKREALLTFWVLKEAAVKLSGEGLQGFPRDTNFSLSDPRVTRMHNCIVAIMKENDHA